MRLLNLLMAKSQERMVKKYGRECAKNMLIAALAMKEKYKGPVPTGARLARRALNTRRKWKQINERIFVYELGPNRDECLEKCSKYEPWLSGTVDITDDKSLWDGVQDVIRTELYWNYLSGLEISKCLELTNLALAQAAKVVGANTLPQADEPKSRTAA